MSRSAALLAIAASLGFSACSQAAPSAPPAAAGAPPPAAGVVKAAATATAAAAPSADAATVWATRLYAQYADDQFSPFATPENWFAPELLKEINDNEKLTPEGEMGAIDADPICSCQDPSGMAAKVTGAAMTGPAAARLQVTMQWPVPPNPIPSQIADYTQRTVLHLVMTPQGWRIADIGDADSSFLKYLREENARARAAR